MWRTVRHANQCHNGTFVALFLMYTVCVYTVCVHTVTCVYRSYGDPELCRKLLQRAVHSASDDPEKVCDALLQFEREEGDLVSYEAAVERCAAQMRRVEERRKKVRKGGREEGREGESEVESEVGREEREGGRKGEGEGGMEEGEREREGEGEGGREKVREGGKEGGRREILRANMKLDPLFVPPLSLPPSLSFVKLFLPP